MQKQQSVHPTAIVGPQVILGENVEIGPFCHISGPVNIGDNTKISPYNYIEGPATIGENNMIGVNCVIGTPAEHKNSDSVGKIVIGNNNVIRELTVIQRGTGDRDTQIGDGCFIMDHVHVAHDVLISDNVTVAPNVVFGGHTVVLHGATIGIGVVTHQHSTIGSYSMVGMNTTVTKDIPPFFLVSGTPGKFQRWNSYQLKQHKIAEPPGESELASFNKNFETFSKRKVVELR